jgi:hypothetical protein
MRENCASGSVGGEGGNALAYPAEDELPYTAIEHDGRICRVGPGNFTPSLSQVGSRTGAPV